MRRLLFTVLLCSAIGCSTYKAMQTYQAGSYEIVLATVDPAGTLATPNYSDSLMAISWDVTTWQLDFELENRASSSMKVIWNEAAYVDVEGMTHRVVHTGVKYSEAGDEMPPTTIPARAKVSDMVAPADGAHWVEGSGAYASHWSHDRLLPDVNGSKEGLEKKIAEFGTKTMVVLLPVEVKGVKTEYTFTFNVAIAPPK